jgi:hypothetical protein
MFSESRGRLVVRRVFRSLVVGALAVAVLMSCDRSAGLQRDFTAAEVLTSGAIRGQNWLVLRLRGGVLDDCVELRTLGAALDRACEPDVQGGRTMLRATEVNGTLFVFGILPDQVTRAEVQAAGQPALALQIRPFGSSGHYAVEAAPPGMGWAYGEAVPATTS